MRKVVLIALLALAVAAGLVFWTGLDDRVARMAVSWQRDYQNRHSPSGLPLDFKIA